MPPAAAARARADARLRALHAQLCAAPAASLAELLLGAWAAREGDADDVALASLPPLADLEEALSVGRAMAASPLAARIGGHCGWKMGWKGSMEERHALCGPLFGAGQLASGAEVSLSAMGVFSAEAEFCVVLGSALGARTAPYAEAEVWAAVGRVDLAIELCGARQFRSEERLHYVADALLSAGVVRGPTVGSGAELEPASLLAPKVRLLVGGAEVSSGDASNNPGDSPLASLTLLANELCVERGLTLAAGTVVICGHCCIAGLEGRPSPSMPSGPKRPEWGGAAWRAGDTLRAEFEGLGAVEVTLMP